jgi:hypothetical protein
MGKFPEDWSLQLIEQVVSYFHTAGVSVHFPTIIGFPTETASERAETYAFLRYITGKYTSVTFNMNVLGFDIGSKLFEQYEDFGITTIRWPVPAKYFLGNLLDWDSAEMPFDYAQCDRERNDLMRRLLYPWMPSTAMIPPYIFYRLCETSRATMVWKAQRQATGNWKDEMEELALDTPMSLSQQIAISPTADLAGPTPAKRFFVYDWGTHHNIECDAETKNLLAEFTSPVTCQEVLGRLQAGRAAIACAEETARLFAPQIAQLYRMGFLQYGSKNPGHASDVSRDPEAIPALVS